MEYTYIYKIIINSKNKSMKSNHIYILSTRPNEIRITTQNLAQHPMVTIHVAMKRQEITPIIFINLPYFSRERHWWLKSPFLFHVGQLIIFFLSYYFSTFFCLAFSSSETKEREESERDHKNREKHTYTYTYRYTQHRDHVYNRRWER